MRSAWTGWLGGILTIVALGLACVDALPWGASVVPLLALAAFLAVRSADEWPRIGFPIGTLAVGLFVVGTGLFKAGVDWSKEWDALRHSGAVDAASGPSPVLGMALAVLLGGAFLGVLFLHADTVWRALSNVRLAVVSLSAVGILSIIGTMVVQRFGAGGLPEPEKNFVEKFMKGQGAIPVNARFMLSPPEVRLGPAEQEKIDLTGRAFGEGKARQMRMGLTQFREKSLKALAIEKHVDERREHLLALFEKLETLGFTNVFRTWWFNALLVLVFVQVVAILVKRYPWGWTQSGWVMTHAGVLVVLAGCVLSDVLLKDGSLALSPGEVSDRFEEYTRLDARGQPTLTELGYRVRMLGTDQSFYHELQVAFPAVRAGDDVLWTQEQLRPGRKIRIGHPDGKSTYEVRILESHERALLETAMISAKASGREGGAPAVKVQFLSSGRGHGDAEHVMDEGYLFADGTYTGRLPAYVARYRVAATAEEARAILSGKEMEGQGRHGLLSVRVPGLDAALAVPATPGATARATIADGTLWTVEVKKYWPAYWVGRADQDQDPEALPEKPALEVEVRRGEGGDDAGRMIVYADPGLQEQWEDMVRQSAAGAHGGAMRFGGRAAGLCSYRYDFAPAVRTLVVEGPGVERTLAVLRPGKDPETKPFAAPGTAVSLGSQGLALRLVEAIPDAVPDMRITPLPQETDEQYIETCRRAVEEGIPPPETISVARIQVVERDPAGERTREEWLIAEKEGLVRARNFVSTDGRLFLGMSETNNAMMFRSAMEVLSADGRPVLEDGKPVRSVVRVNHPLQWGGYAFYQNSFVAGAGGQPPASVFRVKYDRGIPTIYTGFAILTLGVCLLLYLDPFLRRRRREAAAGGAEAGERQEAAHA